MTKCFGPPEADPRERVDRVAIERLQDAVAHHDVSALADRARALGDRLGGALAADSGFALTAMARWPEGYRALREVSSTSQRLRGLGAGGLLALERAVDARNASMVVQICEDLPDRMMADFWGSTRGDCCFVSGVLAGAAMRQAMFTAVFDRPRGADGRHASWQGHLWYGVPEGLRPRGLPAPRPPAADLP